MTGFTLLSLTAFTIISTIAVLLTEGVKKIFTKVSPMVLNIVISCVSVIAYVMYFVLYESCDLTTGKIIYETIALLILTVIGSQVGYDKIKEFIQKVIK